MNCCWHQTGVGDITYRQFIEQCCYCGTLVQRTAHYVDVPLPLFGHGPFAPRAGLALTVNVERPETSCPKQENS